MTETLLLIAAFGGVAWASMDTRKRAFGTAAILVLAFIASVTS